MIMPLIVRDLDDLPSIQGFEWGEAYFASPAAFKAWMNTQNITKLTPDMLACVFPVCACTLLATFRPEKWVNDYAVEVPAEGEVTWRVLPQDMTIDSLDLDFLQSSTNAPSWIRNWSGPFTIEVMVDFPDTQSAHDKFALHSLINSLLDADAA